MLFGSFSVKTKMKGQIDVGILAFLVWQSVADREGERKRERERERGSNLRRDSPHEAEKRKRKI